MTFGRHGSFWDFQIMHSMWRKPTRTNRVPLLNPNAKQLIKMKSNLTPRLPKVWVTSSLDPAKQIFNKTVHLRGKDDWETKGTFQIEEVNGNRMLLRVDYNSSRVLGRVKFDAFRVSQEQIDLWAEGPDA